MKSLVAILLFFCPLLLNSQTNNADQLPVCYEELTAPDFVKAVSLSKGVVIIPLGIMEKHGPFMPLGTDLINARNLAVKAAQKEYAVVFPPYYFGQINEARHQPGTMAYSPQIIWDLLQETCNELSRNGFSKIVLVNGHGGNNDFLKYFVFSQNAALHSYQLYLYQPRTDEVALKKAEDMVVSRVPENHAGEREASEMMYIRPDLVKPALAASEDGTDQARLTNLPDFFTALWWYASYPNHYSGDGTHANAVLGKMLVEEQIDHLALSLQEVKNDANLKQMQDEFNKKTANPIQTKQ